MAKLYSTPLQLIALRGMCSREPRLSGGLLSQLDESHFYGDECSEAYNAILKFIETKGSPPTFNYLCESRDVTNTTRKLLLEAGVPPKNTNQLNELVQRLNKLRQTRVFYSLCTEGLSMLQSDKLDLKAMQDLAQERVSEMQRSKSTEGLLTHIGRDGNADDLAYEILYGENNDQFIPTCWKTFDEPNGGMPRGGLVTIGGSSGAGKSHTVIQLAKSQAMLGYKVVVVPLEMTKEETLVRAMANVAGVDSLRINLKRLTSDEKDFVWRKYKRFQKLVEQRGGRFTIYAPDEDVTIQDTMAAVHSYNADAIYIDYIGLLSGADGDDQWRQLGRIARYGKVYAGNHKKVVALAAQVGDDGRIRYSQAIKEHSSLAFVFMATKESREHGFLNISMLKGRNQKLFDFTLKIDYATSTVRDLEADEVPQAAAPKSGTTSKDGKKSPSKKAVSAIPELEM